MNDSDSYLQRADWHDYTSVCSYLITLRANPQIGKLSDIVAKRSRNDFSARWIPSEMGKIAMSCIRRINLYFPCVEVIRYAIMPDHVHLLLWIKEKTDIHLGFIIRHFKEECNRFLSAAGYSDLALFLGGYNDKIVQRRNQMKVFKRYVEDNPLRYALRREYPEYFNRLQNISIDGEVFSIYGNFTLLRHPQIVQVRISRRDDDKEKQRKIFEWEEAMRGKGVFVSPFYSQAEKQIRDRAIEAGAKIIKIIPNGLPERYKPSGRDFDLCCEGRLLIIAPAHYQTRKIELSREMCLHGNDIAKRIADGALRDMRLLRPSRAM